jgi:hypothetical protein
MMTAQLFGGAVAAVQEELGVLQRCLQLGSQQLL